MGVATESSMGAGTLQALPKTNPGWWGLPHNLVPISEGDQPSQIDL